MTEGRAQAAAKNDLVGVFAMVLSEVLLAGVNAIVKFVPDWTSQQMMVVRYSIDFLLCATAAKVCGYEIPGGGIALRLLLRGCAYVSFIAFLWSAIRSCLPLGDVVVIIIASSPIFLVASTRIFLKEEIPRIWPLQVVICLVGATMVNKPMAVDADCPASWGLLPLGAGLAGAMMNLASRSLKDIPPVTVCLFNDVVAVAFGLAYTLIVNPGSSPVPVSQDLSTALVVGAAFIGWVGLVANVKGYQSVSVTAVASVAGYVSVPLNYGMQVFMFGVVPDIWSTIGACLICGINIVATIQKWVSMSASANDDKSGYTSLDEDKEETAALQDENCGA